MFERGLNATEIRQLFRLIDWMMNLPREQDQLFFEEIQRHEEEKKMPYDTSVEQRRKILLRFGSKHFGPPREADVVALEAITDLERLERVSERLLEVNTWSELLVTL